MKLPETVLSLMERLEENQYEVWAVGGCVRDALLGITPHDYDLCTQASPEETEQVFSDHTLVLAGKKHGTVGVVTDEGVVEITTYRTEGDYQDSRHPGWVRFVPELKQDLARRDFTINAMAYSPGRGYADPFGGRQDLEKGILRAVGEPELRFREDALRILRGIRFAARFRLKPEERTWKAMLAGISGLDTLAKERVFEELCRLLCLADASVLVQAAPVLIRVIPELEAMVGFDQRTTHHAYDVYTHTAHVVEGVPREPELRFAALLHDVGKPGTFTVDAEGCGHFPGHAQAGAEIADGILRNLKAPTAFREEVVWLIDHHMAGYAPEKKAVRRALSRHGIVRLKKLVALEQADLAGKGVSEEAGWKNQLEAFSQMLDEVSEEEGRLSLGTLAVHGRDLMELGYRPGPDLGQALKKLLDLVLSETLPNESQALLEQAEKWIKKQAL